MSKIAKQKVGLNPNDARRPSQEDGNKPEQKNRQTKAVSDRGHAASTAGTTIAAMMKASGWQQHSVRAFSLLVVRKRLKLKLASSEIDGTRVYRIGGGSNVSKAQPPRAKPSTH